MLKAIGFSPLLRGGGAARYFQSMCLTLRGVSVPFSEGAAPPASSVVCWGRSNPVSVPFSEGAAPPVLGVLEAIRALLFQSPSPRGRRRQNGDAPEIETGVPFQSPSPRGRRRQLRGLGASSLVTGFSPLLRGGGAASLLLKADDFKPLRFQSPSPRGRRRQFFSSILRYGSTAVSVPFSEGAAPPGSTKACTSEGRVVSVPFSEGAAPPGLEPGVLGSNQCGFSPLLRGGGAARTCKCTLPERFHRFSPLLRGGGAASSGNAVASGSTSVSVPFSEGAAPPVAEPAQPADFPQLFQSPSPRGRRRQRSPGYPRGSILRFSPLLRGGGAASVLREETSNAERKFQSPSPRGRRRQQLTVLDAVDAVDVSVPFSEGAAPPDCCTSGSTSGALSFSPLLRGGGAARPCRTSVAGFYHCFSPLLRGGGAASSSILGSLS